jgi:hypothetical protein
MRRSLPLLLCVIYPGVSTANNLLDHSYWAIGARIAGIHVNTLYSIAVQESGMRWDDGSLRPWPWTLYVNKSQDGVKKGAYRYRTRAAAETALQRLIDKGIDNIDVGLMQVNLHWHRHRVVKPTHLLTPLINVRVAATILNEVNDTGPAKAVARYHSFNTRLGLDYLHCVKQVEQRVNQRFPIHTKD